MAQTLKDVMTPNPVTLPADTPVQEAARRMRDDDIGDVIVQEGDQLRGIVTDRDIVVRVLAEGMDVAATSLGQICSQDLVTLSSDAQIDEAVQLMRERAIRRLPVVDGGRAVGMVSIGDLAIDRDPDSALADISVAPGNT
jgi:CBS domain-containing protein